MSRYRFFVPILSLGLFLAACNKPTDDAISTQIKAKMFSEPLLKTSSVNIISKDGIVTLTGTVQDDAARLAAERLASQTDGVKQVIDSTTMAAPPAQSAANALPAPAPEPAPARESKKSPAPKKSPSRAPAAAPAPAPAPVEQASATSPSPGPLTPPVDNRPSTPEPPPPPPPPQPITVTIPEGSVVTIRTIDPIDSTTSSAGQFFRASLDAPVVVDDRVVLPKGLNVKLKLVEAASAGKFKGRSELTVSLETITYQGKTYTLSSSDVQEKGGSRGKRSAAVIGGGAVLGALIGGLAGGGKGAAIGAGVGAGGGTAVQAMTKGEQVRIASETRLDFTLHAPVTVTYIPPKHIARPPRPDADQTAPANTDQSAPPASDQNTPSTQPNQP